MDMRNTVREIGTFEMALNMAKVSNSPDVVQKAGAHMPLPHRDIGVRVEKVARWLNEFGKWKYMFLTPEIALAEELLNYRENKTEIIFLLPCDMDREAKERLKNNLPRGGQVSTLEEPYFPESFFPGNSMMVISGYSAGGRTMVLQDTYRMAEHYDRFLGKKVFVPYVDIDIAYRYDGWMEISQQRFSAKWRDN